MADVFKVVGELFGFSVNDQAEEQKPQYVDPAAERRALAELRVSGILQDQDETQPIPSRVTGSAVAKDGTIDFDLFFSQAGFQPDPFTAEQAIKLIANVERTIPAAINDVAQRKELLRNVMLATMTGGATAGTIISDAKKRSETLKSLIRSRLDSTADVKQKSADKIKSLEQQIAAAKAAMDVADRQFTAISTTCKTRQALYAKVIDILTEPDKPSG